RELLAPRAQPGARVDAQDRDPCIGHARARLLAHRAGERVAVAQVDPPCVDQLEAVPVPLAVELLAVARDARRLVHDRLARSAQAVDQRGLPHVWIADHGDLHAASMPCATTPSLA